MKRVKASIRLFTGLVAVSVMSMKNSALASRATQSTLAVMALIVAAGAPAGPPPPPPIDELTAFYQAMDGDNWTRNDHWLDEDVYHCDWYGIRCDAPIVPTPISGVLLPNNNLTGDVAELIDLLDDLLPAFGRADLSGNHITGELPGLLRLESLDLSRNRITGPLPDATGEVSERLRVLRLGNNQFQGEVPVSWEQFELLELDLANNQLSGPTDAAFLALANENPASILLQDNAFSGELPAWVTEIEFEHWPDLGSVNLCWTEIEIPDGEVADWVAEHHVGGPDFDICRNRERGPINPTVSGSWFDADRSGEGFTLMLLDTGAPLIYWFTHISMGRQMWLFDVGQAADTTLFFNDLMRTSGFFGEGFGDVQNPIGHKGSLRADQIESGPLHGEYRINYTTTELSPEGSVIVFMPAPVSMRFDHMRLTQLAGTTCDNQLDHQWISGAWYDPERGGEGFVVEVIEDGRGVVYWFTYEPGGEQQAWMMGDGHFDGTTLHIDNLIQPRDADDGMPFNADGIEHLHWGTLTIEFEDDDSGHIWFDSVDEDYGSGDYPIERLARPMLADCQDDEDTSTPLAIDAATQESSGPASYKGLPLELTNNGVPQVTASDDLVGMVCIGMSNANQECRRLIRGMEEVWEAQIDPQERLVNCALGGHAIERWNDPAFDDVLWTDCADKVAAAGLTLEQVRVILHKAANQFTTRPDGSPLPAYPHPDSDFFNFHENLDILAGRVTDFFPALQAVFTTSRSYGGFAERPARGEPLSYEQGHALNQWLYSNPSVDGVWFGWGPYIWAPDCDTGDTNGAGICYERADFQADGIHPSPAGEIKIATLWHHKLRSQPWYAR